MPELLEEAIVSAIRNLSFSSLTNLWGTTVLAMLSCCSLLKVLVISAYLLIIKLSDWRRLLSNVVLYILGTGFSYTAIVIIFGRSPSWTKTLVPGSSVFYLIFGFFLIIFGFLGLGFFKKVSKRIRLLNQEEPEHDFLVAFLLGVAVVFTEALSCHICNPNLKLVSVIYRNQGPILSTIIAGTLFLGHSTMLLIAGIVISPLKQLLAKYENYEYVRIGASIILILVGLNLLWLA